MKYCSSCKRIVNDECETCDVCNGQASDISGESSVSVTVVKGTSVAVLESALKDAGIPCVFEKTDGNIYNEFNFKVSAESDYRVLVPFAMYNKAFDICEGFSFVAPEDRLIPDDDGDDTEETRTFEEKFESKTGMKHRTWQMLSIILFVIAACLVIWGIDFIAEFIKGLFN